jgi:hypothetical protein
MANQAEFSSVVGAKAPLKSKTSWRGPRWYGLAALGVVASIALSACGSSGTPSVVSGGTTTTTVAAASGSGGVLSSDSLAFARCMRSNGVGNYPDPNSSGATPKETPQQLGVSLARYQSADNSCAHFLPNGGGGRSPAEIARERALGLKFAECVRRHGVPLPDPDSSGRIPDPSSVGVNQGSPKFQAANNACAKYRPPYMPSNAQYNAYVQSNG